MDAIELLSSLIPHISIQKSDKLPGTVSSVAAALHRCLYEDLRQRTAWLAAATCYSSDAEAAEDANQDENFTIKTMTLCTQDASADDFEVYCLCELTGQALATDGEPASAAWTGAFRVQVGWDTVSDAWQISQVETCVGVPKKAAGMPMLRAGEDRCIYPKLGCEENAIEAEARSTLCRDGLCIQCNMAVASGHWSRHKIHCDAQVAHAKAVRATELAIDATREKIAACHQTLATNAREIRTTEEKLKVLEIDFKEKMYRNNLDPVHSLANPQRVEEQIRAAKAALAKKLGVAQSKASEMEMLQTKLEGFLDKQECLMRHNRGRRDVCL